MDFNVVDNIKYSLLTHKDYDSDMIHRAAKLCEVYPTMVLLFKHWMSEEQKQVKNVIYNEICSRVPIMEEHLF